MKKECAFLLERSATVTAAHSAAATVLVDQLQQLREAKVAEAKEATRVAAVLNGSLQAVSGERDTARARLAQCEAELAATHQQKDKMAQLARTVSLAPRLTAPNNKTLITSL